MERRDALRDPRNAREADGFALVFTAPVDATTAANPTSYSMKSFTYFYSGAYGSDEIDVKPAPIASATVSADGLSVHLKVDARRALCDHGTHQERFAVRLPIIGRDIPQ